MALIRGEHHQCAGQSHRAVLLVVREHLVTSCQEGIQIGDGTSGCQNGIATRPANDLTHLGQHHILHENENWRNLVGEHVGVRSGRQPLTSHGDQVQTVGQLIEEVGMSWKLLKKIYVYVFSRAPSSNIF